MPPCVPDLPPIHVWTPGLRPGSGGIQNLARSYVTALRLLFPGHPLRVFSKNDDLDPDDPLRASGMEFWTATAFPKPLRTLAFATRAFLSTLTDHPCLSLTLHLHFLPPLLAARRLTSGCVIAVLHGIEAWEARGWLRQESLRQSDLLIAVSRHTRRLTREIHGLPAQRLQVVPNCFDEAAFRPGPKPLSLLQRHGLTPDQPVLLTVSRLDRTERYKGHDEVLQALPALRRSFPNLRYLIGGTGDYADTLRQRAMDLGVADLVTFTGFIRDAELPAYFQLCDAFIMPSRKEGFGIVFLEAMACGKPVIAGNQDGSVDALDDGRLGLLVDPQDVTALTRAVEQTLRGQTGLPLLQDPLQLHRAVVETFGWDAFVARLRTGLTSGGLSLVPAATEQPCPAPAAALPASITVLTQLTSPYQVEFLNAVHTLAASQGVQLRVVYLTSHDRSRLWSRPEIHHPHLILSESPSALTEARRWLLDADLAVFNYYTHPFAASVLRQRSHSDRPWVFWGERPGALQLGAVGLLFRRFLLQPLHHTPRPIWAVGRHGIEGYAGEFGARHPCVNLPYFSDLTRFRAPAVDESRRASRAPGAIRFLYSGTLSRRKGTDLLARAFLSLALEAPQARLVLVGTGPQERALRRRLAPVIDRVDFLGFVPWADLPQAYARGDVFCFPSRYDGWGLALVEALASGLPAIATDQAGSALEFLQPGRNGWRIASGDSDALLAAMRQALTADLETLGSAARAAVADHDLDHGAARFLAAAQAALVPPPPSLRTA